MACPSSELPSCHGRDEEKKGEECCGGGVAVHHLTTRAVGKCAGGRCLVPPSPAVLKNLLDQFANSHDARRLKFRQWLKERGIGYGCPTTLRGAEANQRLTNLPIENGLARVQIPTKKVSGDVNLMVLLVEFPDARHDRENSRERFQTLLTSEGKLATGSLKEYYREVSLGQANINATVSDYLMMPQNKSFYIGRGYGYKSPYPNNAEKLAEDAVAVAKAQGIVFPSDLDFNQNGSVGAFYLVAAGRGAEETEELSDFWAHKSDMRRPVKVGPRLSVTKYLLVNEYAQLGVCAHELGHLAFEWDDFYDPQRDNEANWDGAGLWDLMAGGNWQSRNVPGDFPCPPAGLHRSQHDWVNVINITSTTLGITLPPQTASQASVIKVTSPAYEQTQFLMVENRSTTKGSKYDEGLPGSGLLIWRVDTAQFQERPENPGMMLVQADKRDDLQRIENSRRMNMGDAGDPFPGQSNNRELADVLGTNVSTSFPQGRPSGVSFKNITVNPTSDAITFDIIFNPTLLRVSRL